MELVVLLARATNSSLFDWLKMPLIRLNYWSEIVIGVIEKEQQK
jgi:hypothetical protein